MMNSTFEQIFISYAREDLDIAKKLYIDLANIGLNVWWDQESLLPGENWKKVISREIKQSRYFLALLSKNSLGKSGFVQKELRIAHEVIEESPSNKVYLIPVRIEECQPLDDWLVDINWVDLYSNYNTGLKHLLQKIAPGKIQHLEIKVSDDDAIIFQKYLDSSDIFITLDENKGIQSSSEFQTESINFEEADDLVNNLLSSWIKPLGFTLTLSAHEIETLYLLSDGDPFLIERGLQLLLYGSPLMYSTEDITKMSPAKLSIVKDKFYLKIIENIFSSADFNSLALLSMSIVPTLFTTHLCSFLLYISLSESQSLLNKFAKGNYVTYEHNSDTYTLNTTLARLLNEYVWVDASGTEEKKWIIKRVISFYTFLLDDLSNKMMQYQRELVQTQLERNYERQLHIINSLEKFSKKTKLFYEQLKYFENISRE